MTPVIPELETARLTLRGHRYDDLDACVAMWSDPAVVKFITGKPSTEHQTWARLLSYAGHWAIMGFGYWVMEEKSTGTYVGEIGFADFKRDVRPPLRGHPEIGFALVSTHHGKGFASEALAPVIAWGDRHLPDRTTVALTDPDNAASMHLLRTFGYVEVERGSLGGRPTMFHTRLGPATTDAAPAIRRTTEAPGP
jgi:RimJ/RimL family protein N-acetyltransferase